MAHPWKYNKLSRKANEKQNKQEAYLREKPTWFGDFFLKKKKKETSASVALTVY